MDKKTTKSGNKSKLVIKDKKRFIVTIIILSLVILIGIIIIVNKRVDLTKVEDYSRLNPKKYSHQLLEEYGKKENKQKFLDDYDYIQNAVGMYIMNNSTTESNSFQDMIKSIKNELKKDKWDMLRIDKPIFWNGDFGITDDGTVTFKFSNKSMEPSWIHDDELKNKVIINN